MLQSRRGFLIGAGAVLTSRKDRKTGFMPADTARMLRNAEITRLALETRKPRMHGFATAEEWQKLAEEMEVALQRSWKFWKRPASAPLIGGFLFRLFNLLPGLDKISVSLRDIVAAVVGSLVVLVIICLVRRYRK